MEKKYLLEVPDYASIRDAFAKELLNASKGEKNSLPFLKNTLPKKPLVSVDEVLQVFVIGGTTGKIALVKNTNQGIIIVSEKTIKTIPVFEKEEDFFTFFDNYLDPKVKTVAINFAYKLLPVIGNKGQLDGVMIDSKTKGHAFSCLTGIQLGKKLQEHFGKNGRNITVTIANDTIYLLLAGLTVYKDKNTLIGGVVGTGCNLTFFLDSQTIVNLQIAGFNKFLQTTSGKLVDKEEAFGQHIFEKEIAGAYLYKHFNVLSSKFGIERKIASTKELAIVAKEEGIAGLLARELFARSASLFAASLAGLYVYKGKPEQLTVVMEGSVFWEGPYYKETVVKQVEKLGIPKEAITFSLVPKADIVGANILVLPQ